MPQLCPALYTHDKIPLIPTMVSLLTGTRASKDPKTGKTGKSEPKPNNGSRKRNSIIATEIVRACESGRRILVLSDRIGHLQTLELILKHHNHNLKIGYYIGGRKQKDLEKVAETCQVILGTNSMAKEAVDLPEIDTLCLASPKSDVVQSIGRILRILPDKKEPIVLDFIDDIACFKSQAKKRLAWYTCQGYKIFDVKRS